MRSTIGTRVIAGGCLLLGFVGGIIATQAVGAAEGSRSVDTGLFSMETGTDAVFRVTLDDNAGAPPARVFLQIFDENGIMVAHREPIVNVGQSASLRVAGPGLLRAHAGMSELSAVAVSARRGLLSSVEVRDADTRSIRLVCPLHNPWPIRPDP